MLFDFLACLGEDAAQHGGHGEYGRPHVEAITLFFQAGGLAAKPVVPLEQDHCITAGGERACGGQAPQAAADDAHASRLSGFHQSRCLDSAAMGQFDWLRLPAAARQSQVFDQEAGGDASRFENDRKPATRVGSSADQIDGLQILKPIARPEVEHLRKVVGQIEGGATVDFVMVVPVGRGNDVFKTDAALDVRDPDLLELGECEVRKRSRSWDQSTFWCWCVTGTRT